MQNVEIAGFDHNLLSDFLADPPRGNGTDFRTVFTKFRAGQVSGEYVENKLSYKAVDVEINDYAVSPALRANIVSPLNWLADGFTRAKNLLSGVKFGKISFAGLEMEAVENKAKTRVNRMAMGPFDGAVLAQLQFDDISLEAPGKPVMALGNLSLEGYDLAMWKGLPQALSGDATGIMDLFATLKFQNFRLAGLKIVEQQDVSYFKLGELRISSPGPLRFSEFSLQDVELGVQPDVGFKLAKLQLEGTDARNAISFFETWRPGHTLPILKPPFLVESIRLQDLTLRTPKGVATLQGVNAAGKYNKESGYATDSRFEATGLKIPVTLLDNPAAQETLGELGYQELILGLKGQGTYDPDKKVATISDISFSMQDAGTLSFAFAMGMDMDMLMGMDITKVDALKFAGSVTYISAEMAYLDASLCNRLLAFAAKKDKTSVGMLKAKLKEGIRQAGGGTPPQTLAALLAFVENPQRLTITFKPAAPVTLQNFVNVQASQGPDGLMNLLNLQVKAN
jgi:hypothetical protein